MTSKILNSLPHLANDSVTKQVTDILSDLIVTGKIVEGDFLPTEEDLCHEFGLEKMKTDEYRLETFADYDFMFHKSIADASGNKVFSLMMETIRPMLYSHIIYTLNPNFNPELSNHFHETILEAIKAKDPNAASAAMAAHLVGTKSIIDELESANVTL